MKPLNYAQAKNKHVWGGYVAGVYYGDASCMINDMKIGQKLLLVAHDDNGHDAYAVGVYVPNENGDWGNYPDYRYSRLGYLPNKADDDKAAKQVIWRMLANGLTLRAVLNSFAHRDGRIVGATVEILFGE